MKQSKSVIDDHEDNFAIVFAAMGVSYHYVMLCMLMWSTMCIVVTLM